MSINSLFIAKGLRNDLPREPSLFVALGIPLFFETRCKNDWENPSVRSF
jgi:hypothetical protein